MLFALVGFILWTIVLLSAMLLWRGVYILKRERKIHEFPSNEPHGDAVYWRINRAHLNALENLPMFAALVLLVLVLVPAGPAREPFEMAAKLVLAARVGQSVTHIVAHNEISVSLRFTFFFVQIAAFAFMAVRLLSV